MFRRILDASAAEKLTTEVSQNSTRKKQSLPYSTKSAYSGCSSPSPRPWARRWRTTNVCDACTSAMSDLYSCLPGRKASPSIGWYQIILLGDRGTCVLTTCPGFQSTTGRLGFQPATWWFQVQRPNHSATQPHKTQPTVRKIINNGWMATACLRQSTTSKQMRIRISRMATRMATTIASFVLS